MRKTKLILVEGLPGSGKSTTAHFLARHLANHNIPTVWWYEEDKGHPLSIFHDRESLQQVLADLSTGHHGRVVAAVLGKWRQFSQALHASETVVLLDSCLFGYLTWSLFPVEVPEEEIHAYLAQVEEIIVPHEPCLIYFHQRDIAASLKRICERRGGTTEQAYIHKSSQSPYGRRRGLQGFEGLVAFWTAYRQIADGAFSRVGFPKLEIENDAGDWSTYQRRILAFLDLLPVEEAVVSPSDLARFVGTYTYMEGDVERSCAVGLAEGTLYVDGVPQVWPRTRLLPKSRNAFQVESLPFEVMFEEDSSGTVTTLALAGREQLWGPVDRVLVKKREGT